MGNRRISNVNWGQFYHDLTVMWDSNTVPLNVGVKIKIGNGLFEVQGLHAYENEDEGGFVAIDTSLHFQGKEIIDEALETLMKKYPGEKV